MHAIRWAVAMLVLAAMTACGDATQPAAARPGMHPGS
jgi:hypothetical protein